MTSAVLAPRTGDAPVALGAANAVRLENIERTFPMLRRGENFALTWKPRWDHSFTSPAAQKELGQAIIRWYGEMRESAGRQQASA